MRILFQFKMGSDTTAKFLRVFFLCEHKNICEHRSGGSVFGRKKGKSITAMG